MLRFVESAGAKVLFSNLTVHELLDPATVAKKKAIERHHLCPAAYLSAQGIKATNHINQVANYALLEWPDKHQGWRCPAARVLPIDVQKARLVG